MNALQQVLPEIRKREASLVAVSAQKPTFAQRMQAACDLTFPVLSDAGSRVLSSYGLVFELPEYLRPLYKRFGIDLEELHGDDKFLLPVPATYVVGRDGKIAWAHIDPDYTRRAEPSDILEALDRLR